jgi:hypothetical protein
MEYSQTDRLPALSAMAKMVGEANGWTYLAGLWLENLDVELLWGTRGYIQKEFHKAEALEETYRGSSWSWASQSSSVAFHPPQTRDKVFNLCSHEIKFPEDAVDTFGVPRFASLVIESPLIKGKIFTYDSCEYFTRYEKTGGSF